MTTLRMSLSQSEGFGAHSDGERAPAGRITSNYFFFGKYFFSIDATTT
jgi:hypothetical protein